MTHLKPTNLIAVTVPIDANHYSLHTTDTHLKLVFSSKIQDPLNCGGDMVVISSDNESTIPKILGEVTEEGVKFDIESYLFKFKATLWCDLPDVYYDYSHDGFDFINNKQKFEESVNIVFPFENSKESFKSLLKANNVVIPNNSKLLILEKI